jgi:hypothetical protein
MCVLYDSTTRHDKVLARLQPLRMEMVNKWTVVLLVLPSAVFGYWQNNKVAGLFLFLFGLLIMDSGGRRELLLTRIEKLLLERLEDPTGAAQVVRIVPAGGTLNREQ